MTYSEHFSNSQAKFFDQNQSESPGTEFTALLLPGLHIKGQNKSRQTFDLTASIAIEKSLERSAGFESAFKGFENYLSDSTEEIIKNVPNSSYPLTGQDALLGDWQAGQLTEAKGDVLLGSTDSEVINLNEDNTELPIAFLDFFESSHGQAVIDVFESVNPEASYNEYGVDDGNWAQQLVQFVDDIKESGHQQGLANLSFDLAQVTADGEVITRFELTEAEQLALQYAQDNNVLLVVAAGNTGSQMSALGAAADDFANIIAVGAVDSNGDRASYSSLGNELTLVAPGVSFDDGVDRLVGTSRAAAHVTGAVAWIWNTNPDLNSQQIKGLLVETSDDLEIPGHDHGTGAGLLDLDEAIEVAEQTLSQELTHDSTISVSALEVVNSEESLELVLRPLGTTEELIDDLKRTQEKLIEQQQELGSLPISNFDTEELETQINSVHTEYQELRNEQLLLDARKKQLLEEEKLLNAQIQTDLAQSAELQTLITKLETEIVGLNGRKSKLQSEVESLESQKVRIARISGSENSLNRHSQYFKESNGVFKFKIEEPDVYDKLSKDANFYRQNAENDLLQVEILEKQQKINSIKSNIAAQTTVLNDAKADLSLIQKRLEGDPYSESFPEGLQARLIKVEASLSSTYQQEKALEDELSEFFRTKAHLLGNDEQTVLVQSKIQDLVEKLIQPLPLEEKAELEAELRLAEAQNSLLLDPEVDNDRSQRIRNLSAEFADFLQGNTPLIEDALVSLDKIKQSIAERTNGYQVSLLKEELDYFQDQKDSTEEFISQALVKLAKEAVEGQSNSPNQLQQLAQDYLNELTVEVDALQSLYNFFIENESAEKEYQNARLAWDDFISDTQALIFETLQSEEDSTDVAIAKLLDLQQALSQKETELANLKPEILETQFKSQVLTEYRELINSYNPLGYWQLDEQNELIAQDATANKLHGNYKQGVSTGKSGILSGSSNRSAQFDGQNDYLEIVHSKDLELDEGTVSFWFSPDSVGRDHQTLFSKDFTASIQGFGAVRGHIKLFLANDGGLFFNVGAVHPDGYLTSLQLNTAWKRPIKANQWHQTSISWTNEGLSLYLDGAKLSSFSYSRLQNLPRKTIENVSWENTKKSIILGSGHSYTPDEVPNRVRQNFVITEDKLDSYFSGRIDEVTLFDSPLEEADIARLYNVSQKTLDIEAHRTALVEEIADLGEQIEGISSQSLSNTNAYANRQAQLKTLLDARKTIKAYEGSDLETSLIKARDLYVEKLEYLVAFGLNATEVSPTFFEDAVTSKIDLFIEDLESQPNITDITADIVDIEQMSSNISDQIQILQDRSQNALNELIANPSPHLLLRVNILYSQKRILQEKLKLGDIAQEQLDKLQNSHQESLKNSLEKTILEAEEKVVLKLQQQQLESQSYLDQNQQTLQELESHLAEKNKKQLELKSALDEDTILSLSKVSDQITQDIQATVQAWTQELGLDAGKSEELIDAYDNHAQELDKLINTIQNLLGESFVTEKLKYTKLRADITTLQNNGLTDNDLASNLFQIEEQINNLKEILEFLLEINGVARAQDLRKENFDKNVHHLFNRELEVIESQVKSSIEELNLGSFTPSPIDYRLFTLGSNIKPTSLYSAAIDQARKSLDNAANGTGQELYQAVEDSIAFLEKAYEEVQKMSASANRQMYSLWWTIPSQARAYWGGTFKAARFKGPRYEEQYEKEVPDSSWYNPFSWGDKKTETHTRWSTAGEWYDWIRSQNDYIQYSAISDSIYRDINTLKNYYDQLQNWHYVERSIKGTEKSFDELDDLLSLKRGYKSETIADLVSEAVEFAEQEEISADVDKFYLLSRPNLLSKTAFYTLLRNLQNKLVAQRNEIQSQLTKSEEDESDLQEQIKQGWAHYNSSNSDGATSSSQHVNTLERVLANRSQFDTSSLQLQHELSALIQASESQSIYLNIEANQLRELREDIQTQLDSLQTKLQNTSGQSNLEESLNTDRQTFETDLLIFKQSQLKYALQLLQYREDLLNVQQESLQQKQEFFTAQQEVLEHEKKLLDAYIDNPAKDFSLLKQQLEVARKSLSEARTKAAEAEVYARQLADWLSDWHGTWSYQNNKQIELALKQQEILNDLTEITQSTSQDITTATQLQQDLNALERELLESIETLNGKAYEEAKSLHDLAFNQGEAAQAYSEWQFFKERAQHDGKANLAQDGDSDNAAKAYDKWQQLKNEQEGLKKLTTDTRLARITAEAFIWPEKLKDTPHRNEYKKIEQALQNEFGAEAYNIRLFKSFSGLKQLDAFQEQFELIEIYKSKIPTNDYKYALAEKYQNWIKGQLNITEEEKAKLRVQYGIDPNSAGLEQQQIDLTNQIEEIQKRIDEGNEDIATLKTQKKAIEIQQNLIASVQSKIHATFKSLQGLENIYVAQAELEKVVADTYQTTIDETKNDLIHREQLDLNQQKKEIIAEIEQLELLQSQLDWQQVLNEMRNDTGLTTVSLVNAPPELKTHLELLQGNNLSRERLYM